MAEVAVTPSEFHLVFFDAGRIAAIAGDVADRVGLRPDAEVRIDVDERVRMGRVTVTSLDPITVAVEGGAFEDARRPRRFAERATANVLGRTLLRVRDRLDPHFGAAPADEDLTLAQQVAWSAYLEGRCDRLGLPTQQQRWRYHFRNRHGFSDAADGAFDRLWAADGLTWADLEALCAESAAAAARAALRS